MQYPACLTTALPDCRPNQRASLRGLACCLHSPLGCLADMHHATASATFNEHPTTPTAPLADAFSQPVRMPIYVHNVSEDEDFGFKGLAAHNCGPFCYNATTRTKLWG